MNERLLQFLRAENISQTTFADTIGVARASVSHILSGRNKPGFDFIEKILHKYPNLNIEWLISGKGKMYKQFDSPALTTVVPSEEVVKSLDSADSPSLFDHIPSEVPSGIPAETHDPAPDKSVTPQYGSVSGNKKIAKIIVFYDDNTFGEYLKGE